MRLFNTSKQSKAKKVAHPVKGRLIHSARDEYGLIQVIDTDTTRSLYFDSPVEQGRLYFQAPMTLAFEYQQLMLDVLSEFDDKHKIENTLMLGLGGGLLTNHLHCYWPNSHHHVVELRQAVIDTAKTYFFMNEDDNIHIHHQDALDFIDQAVAEGENYTAILIDLYDGDAMPDIFASEAFLTQLKALKTSKNLLVFNLWLSSPDSTLKVVKFWEALPYKIQVDRTQSTGNMILSIH